MRGTDEMQETYASFAVGTTSVQATEVAIRAGVLNRMAELARPQSVRIAWLVLG